MAEAPNGGGAAQSREHSGGIRPVTRARDLAKVVLVVLVLLTIAAPLIAWISFGLSFKWLAWALLGFYVFLLGGTAIFVLKDRDSDTGATAVALALSLGPAIVISSAAFIVPAQVHRHQERDLAAAVCMRAAASPGDESAGYDLVEKSTGLKYGAVDDERRSLMASHCARTLAREDAASEAAENPAESDPDLSPRTPSKANEEAIKRAIDEYGDTVCERLRSGETGSELSSYMMSGGAVTRYEATLILEAVTSRRCPDEYIDATTR